MVSEPKGSGKTELCYDQVEISHMKGPTKCDTRETDRFDRMKEVYSKMLYWHSDG